MQPRPPRRRLGSLEGITHRFIGGKKRASGPHAYRSRRWTEEQIEAYARLLHLKPEDVLKRDRPFFQRTRMVTFAIRRT